MSTTQRPRQRCSTCGAPCAACAAKEHADAKVAFHKKYRAILTRVAKTLGLRPSEFKVRVNQGGVAIMGDVSLHTKDLYISVSGYHLGDDPPRFMFRLCNGLTDFGGSRGPNQWLPLTALEGDATEAIDAFRKLISEDT